MLRWYEARASDFEAETKREARRVELLGTSRLAVFVLAVLSAAWLFSLPPQEILAGTALIVTVGVFVALVAVHARARAAVARARALCNLNLRGAARVRRDWSALPLAREPVPAAHPYAVDLDVAGIPASLYRLLDVASAATGRRVLMEWLLAPPPGLDELRERQRAVAELAPAIEFREELTLLGERAGEIGPDRLERFLHWAEGADSIALQSSMIWAARLVPLATLATTALAFAGRLPWMIPGLSFVVGLFILGRSHSALEASVTSVFLNATGLRGQRQMLERVAVAPATAPLLVALRDRAAGGSGALLRLERALSLIEGRGSLMHGIANAVALWDLHAVAHLEQWRRHDGAALRRRLGALGEVEALAALATLAHDNPAWRFPTFEPGAGRLTATALGHPMLPAATRIANDVTVGPPGTVLLVTGSNMSGKSTLLRSIGLNVVLAHAGAPVCAAGLTLPEIDLHTSIRLADSLERGVSLFMAELQRLKQIVDAARTEPRSRLLLYLLDEILHGTNSAERRIAARAVLGHLLHAGAVGVVTTHDLGLAAEGELAAASVPVHFTEHVGAGDGTPAMTFDYRLRPGLATSTNALRLLALVGLGSGSSSAK